MNGHNVGLDGVVRRARRVAEGHGPFEERSDGSLAVVTSGAQDDGAFLVQGNISAAVGQRSVVPGGQASRLRVAAFDRIGRPPVALDQGGDERAWVALVVRVRTIRAGK